MKFNVEKLKKIARPTNDAEYQERTFREKNRDWLSLSAKFALCVRHILRTEKITQKELANKMAVSPSQITKILSGKENLSLQTITKVEKAIGRSIISISDSQDEFTGESKTAISTDIVPYEIPIPAVYFASEYFDDTYSLNHQQNTHDNTPLQ